MPDPPSEGGGGGGDGDLGVVGGGGGEGLSECNLAKAVVASCSAYLFAALATAAPALRGIGLIMPVTGGATALAAAAAISAFAASLAVNLASTSALAARFLSIVAISFASSSVSTPAKLTLLLITPPSYFKIKLIAVIYSSNSQFA